MQVQVQGETIRNGSISALDTPTPPDNRHTRRAKAKGKKAPKTQGARLVVATNVLVQQRAVLARLLSALLVKLGGEYTLTREDLDAACNLGFVAKEADDGTPVLLLANGDKGAPLGISMVDAVTLLSLGGK